MQKEGLRQSMVRNRISFLNLVELDKTIAKIRIIKQNIRLH